LDNYVMEFWKSIIVSHKEKKNHKLYCLLLLFYM